MSSFFQRTMMREREMDLGLITQKNLNYQCQKKKEELYVCPKSQLICAS